MILDRRKFIARSAATMTGVALAGGGAAAAGAAPIILTGRKVPPVTKQGELIFRPFLTETYGGPDLLSAAHASDVNWDAFHSDIKASAEGVVISDVGGRKSFGINVRWPIEDFGYLYLTADNGGEFYRLPPIGKSATLNLNYELARSRVWRNRKRIIALAADGWKLSRESQALTDLAENFLADAEKMRPDAQTCGRLAQKALHYAVRAGEKVELEHADYRIRMAGRRRNFFVGCDARAYFQMDPDLFLTQFAEVFDYATITHYLTISGRQDFEPVEGRKQFNLRTVLLRELRDRNITVEGRPLFYFYKTTTPEWLRKKSYAELLKYVEKHARSVINHYGDEMYAWEVVNEMHDWANELQLNPDQLVEVTRLACEVARDANPKVLRLINNCCPFAEYVQLAKWTDLDAKYPQRTPYQFVKQLVDSGVDFDLTGVQMYFPYRDLSDTILHIERFEAFGKRVQLTEVGASSGPSDDSVKSGSLGISNEPYAWHRPWDEALQAEWLEGIYTLAYSKPFIEAVNWYDFVDPHSIIKNGGLLRSPRGEKKSSFDRIKLLRARWEGLPPGNSKSQIDMKNNTDLQIDVRM
jgi:hypothetical protein